jgi:predicted DNA-binding protein YlxM (UPF0122 family)
MDLSLWNTILSALIAVLGWLAKTLWAEVNRLSILLNRTREEVARDYVTKAAVHSDINRVLDQLDRLDKKLDRIMEPKR